MTGDVSRRRLLGGAAGAAGLAGLGGLAGGCTGHHAAAPHGASASLPAGHLPSGASKGKRLRHYISRPDLRPPIVTLSRRVHDADTRHIFLNAPYSGSGHGGSIILDPHGDLVWMGPDTPSAHRLDFNTQILNGKPVLTWWEGRETSGGWGQGVAVVADSSYRRIHTIHAANGLLADHHEFNITPQGTALISVFRPRVANLTAVGGPARGVLASGVAQEIDIVTGKLLFEWDSLDHVPVSESNQIFAGGTADDPYDYFHINSIAVAPDGDLLISARDTWTIYKVARPSGKIVWRMNGKKSDFVMGPGTHFYWQHHVRQHGVDQHGAATLSVFDNGSAPPREKHSRAIVLHVDTNRMHVTLKHQYIHPGRVLLSSAMGSAQLLPDGRMFVGWGTNPYFSEFAADGELVMDGTTGNGHASYRTFVGEWTGHPTDRPAVAARHRSGGATVYASWNGATNVASWTVLAGKHRASMRPIVTAPRAGFETAIAVHNSGPYFAVQPHDARGHMLATSPTVNISG